LGATGDRVHDQRQRAAGLQHVVHGLRYALLVGPVEGDVAHACLAGGDAGLAQHVGIGVQPDHFGEAPGQPHGEDAWATASVEHAPGAVQTQFLGKHSFQLRRVRRPT
jgi:hypothetical protein